MKRYSKNRLHDTKKEKNDVHSLMINNLGEMKQFYKLAKDQANEAYRLAKNSSIAGIVLITISIFISFFFNDNPIALATTIGGMIVEILAGTSLLIYKKTLNQLNFYYLSLHKNERFLSIISIASQTKMRDKLYKEIVKRELENLKEYELQINNTE